MSVTFTRKANAYSRSAGTSTVTESTVTGEAIKVRGDPQRYQALGLVLTTMPTLLFTPDTYGEVPQPGDLVTWPETNGIQYTVRDVDTVAPDGVVIVARVIIG